MSASDRPAAIPPSSCFLNTAHLRRLAEVAPQDRMVREY
jgi:hypothetical protein